MSIYIAALGFGLAAAAALSVSTVAFTMQFGITDTINVAFGPIMIASAYVAYALNVVGLNVWLAMVVAGGFGAVISYAVNRGVYGPFLRRGTSQFALVVVSIAVALVVQNVLLAIVGPDTVSYRMDAGATIRIGAIVLTTVQVAVMGLAVVTMIAIHIMLRYTKIGKAMRATRADPGLARNCGIRTGRIVDVVWLITGFLSGISGTIYAINSGSFDVNSATTLLVVLLAAAFLGGIGEPYGAMVGAVFIGIVTELSAAAFSPEYKNVTGLLLLVAVLLVRPRGVFTRGTAAV